MGYIWILHLQQCTVILAAAALVVEAIAIVSESEREESDSSSTVSTTSHSAVGSTHSSIQEEHASAALDRVADRLASLNDGIRESFAIICSAITNLSSPPSSRHAQPLPSMSSSAGMDPGSRRRASAAVKLLLDLDRPAFDPEQVAVFFNVFYTSPSHVEMYLRLTAKTSDQYTMVRRAWLRIVLAG